MIRVSFERGESAQGLMLTGHATGDRLVCAGASAMVFALAGWLQKNAPAGLACRLKPGDAWVLCRRSALTDAAFDVVLTGLSQLAENYPELVGINEVSCGGRAEGDKTRP